MQHGSAQAEGAVQEKQIRGKQAMKQLSDRMRDQRVQVADRVRKHVAAARILPKVVSTSLCTVFISILHQLSVQLWAHVLWHPLFWAWARAGARAGLYGTQLMLLSSFLAHTVLIAA